MLKWLTIIVVILLILHNTAANACQHHVRLFLQSPVPERQILPSQKLQSTPGHANYFMKSP